MLTDAEIVPAFHQLIDEIDHQPIENKKYLRELYDSIAGLLHIKGDVLDGMTADELEKTKKAMLEVKNNNITPEDVVRQKIAQKWNIR